MDPVIKPDSSVTSENVLSPLFEKRKSGDESIPPIIKSKDPLPSKSAKVGPDPFVSVKSTLASVPTSSKVPSFKFRNRRLGPISPRTTYKSIQPSLSISPAATPPAISSGSVFNGSL